MNAKTARLAAAIIVLAVPLVTLGSGARAGGRGGGDSVQVQTPLDGQGSNAHETNLGDLVADAARQSAGVDVAVVASDEISDAQIPAGAVPVSRIVGVLSYAADPTDTLVVLKLTGAQLTQVLERSVSRAPQGFDGFLQVSGLTFAYDPSKPEGSRITQITVGGTALSPAQTYQVVTTKPVADGSFGYFRLWGPGDVVQDTHVTLAAGLTAYLDARKSLDVHVENRISP